jgi:quercetin dioxygenase-like cupin family protein
MMVQPERTLAAGESVSVPLNAVHNEGAAGTTPVKLLATFIVEKGKPLAEMVK